MTTADLDGDQHVDLVLGNQDGSITVLAGTASGFAAPVSYAASTTGSATGIAAGDLDGNGMPDVVLLANDHAFVLRNDGTGQLDLAGSYAAGDHPAAAAIGDLDHDGDADLVIADANIGHTSPSGTTILLGSGNATFAPPVAGPGPDATSVALADLDGDGTLDLIAANPGAVSPWLGNGDGTFQSGRALSDPLQATTLRDVTGDSLLDRIGIASAGLVMSAGGPGAAFAPPTTLVAGTCSAYVLEDLDGDGNVDAVATCGASSPTQPGTATVVFGDGHGTFARTATITADAPGTRGVISGDVDGDCLADVMITNQSSTQVFRSAADGTFSQIGVDLPAIDAVALTDVNSDDKVDLFAADGTVRLGNGDGTFGQPQQVASAIDAVGDVDRDGNPDVITHTGIRRGFVNGQFFVEVATDGRPPLFDIDGDGNLDLIGGGIALGHGDGTFSPRIPYATWNAAAAGDVDGDGYADVVGERVVLQRCLP
jgi:hypothetical protein